MIRVLVFSVVAVWVLLSPGWALANASGTEPPPAQSQYQEEPTTNWLLWFSGSVAAFTLVLAGSTGGLWYHTYRIAKHTADSERAYVTMSHKPPGLDVSLPGGRAAIIIEIKNHGRTPATITNTLLQLNWFGEQDPAPDRPVYRTDIPRAGVGAFLVAQGHFFLTVNLQIPNEGAGDELWLYGYVDYTDTFGRRHRAGYARAYRENPAERLEKENNLVFVDKAGWNYDRPID